MAEHSLDQWLKQGVWGKGGTCLRTPCKQARCSLPKLEEGAGRDFLHLLFGVIFLFLPGHPEKVSVPSSPLSAFHPALEFWGL